MSRRFLSALNCSTVLLALAVISAPYIHAQDYVDGTGLPNFTTAVPVELGAINIANGNLHLEVPIASPPGRGSLNVGEKMVYDSRIWSIVNNGTSQVWQPNTQTAGWRFADLRRSGIVTYNESGPFNCSNGQGTYVTYGNFTWQEPNGTNLGFPVQTTQGCGTDSPTGEALGTDASGLSLYVSNFTQGYVTDTRGTQIYDVPTDANGNYITHNSNGDAIDTVGRVPVETTVAGNQTFLEVLNSQTGRSRYTLNYTTINVSTAFGQSGVTEYSGSLTMLSSIQLPDGTSYQFGYDGYGELNSITLRTGGQITYGYTNFTDAYGQINRWASSRTSGGGTWSYTPTVISTCPSGQQNCQQKVVVTKPSNDSIQNVFTMNGGAWNTQITYYDHSGAQLANITKTFDLSQTCSGCTGAAYVKLSSSVTSLNIPGNTISKQVQYTYDSATTSNVTVLKEWNFYTGSPGPTPDRETDTSYYTPGHLNITSLPSSVTIKNSSGTQVAQTLYTYDRYDLTGLSSVTGVVQHDDGDFGPSDTIRGNLTTVQSWASGSTYVTTAKYWYDTTGQVTQSSDAAGNVTAYSYADNYYSDNGNNPPPSFSAGQATNAYATSTTVPLIGSSSTGYYYGTGKAAYKTDQNGRTAYSHFLDSLDRPSVSIDAGGGWVDNVYTSATQADAYTGIVDTIPSSGCSSCRHDEIILDNLGRVSNSVIVNDPDGQIKKLTSYDSNGRVSSQTNPYRSTSDSTYGSTLTSYDGLDRAIQITRPDGNVATSAFGAALSSATSICGITGFPSVSTDEAGNNRQFWTDGFGRLVEVDEPDASRTFSIGTCYQYDVLNNLLNVTQRGGTTNSTQWRTRSFTYDGMSRLTQAAAPESGNINYLYTTNGSPCSGSPSLACSRTDARNITTSYAYDALNRLTGKSYTDGTATVAYYYDQSSYNGLTITNGRGRRTGMSDGSGQTAWSYDADGRVLKRQQTFAGNTGAIAYTYNVNGSVATITSPNGHTYSYTYSNAMRSVALADNGSGITYVQNAHYAAPGELTSAQHGLNLAITETNSYNNRLQPTLLSASSSSLTDLSLSYNWVLPNGKNNGNVYQIQNNRDTTRSVQYSYDQLNRLASAATYNATTWGDAYVYDNWGNLLQKNVTQGTAETLQVTVDVHNHINSGGFSYDASGNMSNDGSNALKYDAENRVTPSTGHVYTYDGDNHRVSNVNGSTTSYYWYDDNFNVISTTGTVATRDYVYFNGRQIGYESMTSGNQHYYWSDYLGSPQTITNSSGSTIQWDSDYYPFGTKRVLNNSEGNYFLFADYLFDYEIGDYYAENREQSPNLGRFVTPDPLAGRRINPQSLNRYAYAANNPLKFKDPTGAELAELDDVAAMDPGAGGGGGYWGYWEDDGLGNGITDSPGYTGSVYYPSSEFGPDGSDKPDPAGPVLTASVTVDLPTPVFTVGDEVFSSATGQMVGQAPGAAPAQDLVGAGLPFAAASVGISTLGEATGTSITGFRAVSTDEFDDILNTGNFNKSGTGSLNKYFFDSSDQAVSFGDRMYGSGNYGVVQGDFPSAAVGDRINPATEGPGFVVPNENLSTGTPTVIQSPSAQVPH